MNSYSGYLADIAKWWSENISEDWFNIRSETYGISTKRGHTKRNCQTLRS